MNRKLNICIRRRRVAIPLGNIFLMEKDKRKIRVHSVSGTISFYGRFCDIEAQLDDRFMSPHSSYMFNFDYITAIGTTEVEIENGISVYMCRKCIGELKQAYDNYVEKNLEIT